MPRRKFWKKGKAHQSLEDKNEMRQMDGKEKDDLLTGNERKGLNFPKKAENGLNFPKKAENGLNFPKKAENGLNFPKKAENGLNFPKKAENGLNFPKKADSVAKKLFILVGWGRSFLSVAWPTGVQLVFFFCSGVSGLFGAQGSPSSGSLLSL